jgi:hypothetical protein
VCLGLHLPKCRAVQRVVNCQVLEQLVEPIRTYGGDLVIQS